MLKFTEYTFDEANGTPLPTVCRDVAEPRCEHSPELTAQASVIPPIEDVNMHQFTSASVSSGPQKILDLQPYERQAQWAANQIKEQSSSKLLVSLKAHHEMRNYKLRQSCNLSICNCKISAFWFA